MGKEYTAKTFKSGNSVALRLPKGLGLREGLEMKVREEKGSFILELAPPQDQKLNLQGIYGSIPGIRRPPCDANPRDWGVAASHA